MTAEDLSHYGNNKLLKLLNHYGSDMDQTCIF